MFNSKLIFILLFVASSTFAGELHKSSDVVLEAVDGSAPVEMKKDGVWHPIAIGVAIEKGSSVRTTESSARLVYEDGSVVALSTNSEVQLMPGTLRLITLESGTVWGKVTKLAPTAKLPSVLPEYRFLLRGRSAVMGVRGTEFLVESTRSGEVTISTLEGVVDTATDLQTLLSGRGSPLPLHTLVRGKIDASLGNPEPFNPTEFVAALEKNHAGLVRFLGRPVRNVLPMKRSGKPVAPKVSRPHKKGRTQ